MGNRNSTPKKSQQLDSAIQQQVHAIYQNSNDEFKAYISKAIYDDDEPLYDEAAIKPDAKMISDSKHPFSSSFKLRYNTLRVSSTLDTIEPVLFTLKTEKMKEGSHVPLDLVCVFHTNGSMKDAKLTLLKDTLKFLVDLLGEDDRISIVKFDSSAKRLTPLQRVTKSNKIQILKTIDSVPISEGANLAAGMTEAVKVLNERKYTTPVSSVFFFTDGLDSEVTASAYKRSQTQETKDTSTGNSYEEDNSHDCSPMNSIAELTDGKFYFVEKLETVDECFAHAIDGLENIVGQDTTIEIQAVESEIFPKIRIKKAYGGAALWDVAEGTYRTEMSQISSGETKNFVLELLIPKYTETLSDSQRAAVLAKAIVTTKLPNGEIWKRECELKVNLINENEELPQQQADEEVSQQYQKAREAEMQDLEEEKIPWDGYIFGKKERLQRYHARTHKTASLRINFTIEDYNDQVAMLADYYMGGMKEMPSLGDIKLNLGIADTELARKVEAALNKKISELKSKLQATPQWKVESKPVYKPHELIPMLNIQTGPQLFNSGFRVYNLDIFYSGQLESEITKIYNKLSSLRIEYTPGRHIIIKPRLFLIVKAAKTIKGRNSDMTGLYLVYSNFSDPEEFAALTKIVASGKTRGNFVLYLPKQSVLAETKEKFVLEHKIKLIHEEEGINQIALHINQEIKKRISETELWQEIYRDAFLDFKNYMLPSRDYLDYGEFMNMLNAKLAFQEFDIGFANTFIKPFIKPMKEREDVIEVHYLIMNNLKKSIEEFRLKIADLDYNIRFPSKYTLTVEDGDDIEQLLQQEVEKLRKEKLESERKRDRWIRNLRYLEITALIPEEKRKIILEKAHKKQLDAAKNNINEKTLKMLEDRLEHKKTEKSKYQRKRQAVQCKYDALSKLAAEFTEYAAYDLLKITLSSLPKNLIEMTPDRKIEVLEEWFSSEKTHNQASSAHLLSKVASGKGIPPLSGKKSHLEKLYESIESKLLGKFGPFPLFALLSHKAEKVVQEVKSCVGEQSKIIMEFIKEILLKMIRDDLVEKGSEREYPNTMLMNIARLNQVISTLSAMKLEMDTELTGEVKSFSRKDIFEMRFARTIFSEENEPSQSSEKHDEETKKSLEEGTLNESNPAASKETDELGSKELKQLIRMNLFLLKLSAVQTTLNLLEKSKRELCDSLPRLARRFKRAAKIEMNTLKGRMCGLGVTIESLNRDINRIELTKNRIQFIQEEDNALIEAENFVKSVSTKEEEQKKLRDYLDVFMKTIENYYKAAGILERGLERKNGQDTTDFVIENCELLLSCVPFGKYIAEALKTAKWVPDQKKESISENSFLTFSSVVLNYNRLRFILENAAFQLIKAKKGLILNLDEKVYECVTQRMQKESGANLANSERLFNGLDTGAKRMAAIDAAFVIANMFASFLVKPKKGVDSDDIYNTQTIVDLLVECGKQVDESRYFELLVEGQIQIKPKKDEILVY